MDDWKLFDSSGLLRRGIPEAEAKSLVDINHAEGNTSVYAIGPNDERYPAEGE